MSEDADPEITLLIQRQRTDAVARQSRERNDVREVVAVHLEHAVGVGSDPHGAGLGIFDEQSDGEARNQRVGKTRCHRLALDDAQAVWSAHPNASTRILQQSGHGFSQNCRQRERTPDTLFLDEESVVERADPKPSAPVLDQAPNILAGSIGPGRIFRPDLAVVNPGAAAAMGADDDLAGRNFSNRSDDIIRQAILLPNRDELSRLQTIQAVQAAAGPEIAFDV